MPEGRGSSLLREHRSSGLVALAGALTPSKSALHTCESAAICGDLPSATAILADRSKAGLSRLPELGGLGLDADRSALIDLSLDLLGRGGAQGK